MIKGELIRRGIRLVKRTTRTILHIPISHRYGNFSILLPPYHNLPTYQMLCPLYDRFLPHLSKYLQPHDLVIDVGANCGDTLAGMFEANPSLSFFCVEADEEFFGYLTRNITHIKSRYPEASITAFQAFAAANVKGGLLQGSRGTKAIVLGSPQDGKLRRVRLDAIPEISASP